VGATPAFLRHLDYTAVVQRLTETRSASSGEVIPTWATAGTVACRFADKVFTRPARERSVQVLFGYRLLVDGTADVRKTDRIIDVKDYNAALVDAGPFSVEERLERRHRRKGIVHHLSFRLERVK